MTDPRILSTTVAVVATELPKVTHTPAFCIMAARCTVDVLDYFGVSAMAMSVDAKVMNLAMAQMLEAHFTDGVPIDLDERDRRDAWLIANTGEGAIDRKAGTWGGHMAAVTDQHELLDASFAQFSRPQHSMPCPPGIIARPAVINGQPSDDAYLWQSDTTLAAYTLRPSDRSYTSAGDWRKHARMKRDVGQMIRRVRRLMEDA